MDIGWTLQPSVPFLSEIPPTVWQRPKWKDVASTTGASLSAFRKRVDSKQISVGVGPQPKEFMDALEQHLAQASRLPSLQDVVADANLGLFCANDVVSGVPTYFDYVTLTLSGCFPPNEGSRSFRVQTMQRPMGSDQRSDRPGYSHCFVSDFVQSAQVINGAMTKSLISQEVRLLRLTPHHTVPHHDLRETAARKRFVPTIHLSANCRLTY